MDVWGYSDSSLTSSESPYVENRFDDAFVGVCSLRDMEMAVEPISEKEIKKNMGDLRRKLARSTSPHAGEIRLNLIEISDSDLTWRDPIASQVISDDSNLVKELEGPAHLSFMRPAQHMQLVMPDVIRNKCTEFVENFSNDDLNGLSVKYRHNNTWKESEESLVGIVEEILRTLGDVWKNPAFRPNFVNMQSEGTYVTDVVVPLLRSTLKNLPVGKINLLSTAERQSVASADRMDERKQGKRPDVMFMTASKEKLYELMFVECSRIICNDDKKENDKVKLWREMNDGMAYVHGGCKPDKNEFGIVGIQVAGRMLHLNVLIKDTDDINHLYHLRSVEIPIQPVDEEGVSQFVEALLILRNNLIVNISLLMNAPEAKSERQKKRSSTVSSDREDN
ncbi:6243_t:CDS:2 [Entrophospora sp. SA101]|nr:6243_t:CDS:2 [Entrophospora sp. SA101]